MNGSCLGKPCTQNWSKATVQVQRCGAKPEAQKKVLEAGVFDMCTIVTPK